MTIKVERVGVVSTRKYAKRLTFWTLQHLMSTSSLALNMLALCLRENTPSDLHFGLCYTSCLRSLALNMLALCLRENTPSDYILDFVNTSCLRALWR